MTVWINTDLCNVCGKCVKICPYNAIKVKNNILSITDRCTECISCANICKNNAILISNQTRILPDFNRYKDVWVFIEQSPNGIRTVSKEILSEAQKLAEILEQKVVAVILGYGVLKKVSLLKNLGVDRIIVIDDKILRHYDAVSYSYLIQNIVKSRRPNIFLFGATYIGRDLAPRVAQLVCSGLTADCTKLKIDPEEGLLIQIRPAFGGNILAKILNRYSRPQMATIRPGVMLENNCIKRKNTKVEILSCDITKNSTKILNSVIKSNDHIRLKDAKIIVAGGRGMKNFSGFKMLYNLASSMNAEVAGTRVAVENGWISEKNQIGQTGQTVRPDLYIACGISGAIQHRAGITDSKFIVAINKDPNAIIFKTANWGVVGDVFDIIPKLTEYIKTKKNLELVDNLGKEIL